MKKFFDKVADVLYRKRSDAWKAAAATAAFTFVGTFSGLALTLVSGVQDAIDSGDTAGLVEDLRVASKATLSATVAFLSFVPNYIYRWAQSKGKLPGAGPSYELPPPSPPQ